MINVFVSVGTHEKPFSRLINKIETISNNKKLDFFIQAGLTPFNSKKLKGKDFLSDEEFLNRIKKSDVVVAHAGAGIIINSLNFKKPLILVPRLREFNEHSNNHQKELVLKLSGEKIIFSCTDLDELEKLIFGSVAVKKQFTSTKNSLAKSIKGFLDGID